MSLSKIFQYCGLLTLSVAIVGCSDSSSDSTSSTSTSDDSQQASAPSMGAPDPGGDGSGSQAAADDPSNFGSGPGGGMGSGPAGGMGSGPASGFGPGPGGGMMPPGGNPGGQMASRPTIPRPANPAQWTSQHITAAVEERDAKVIPALAAYADQHVGEDNAAQEVVAWLQLLNEPAVKAGNPMPGGYGPGAPYSSGFGPGPGGFGAEPPAGEGYGAEGAGPGVEGHGEPGANPAAPTPAFGPGTGHAGPNPGAEEGFNPPAGPGGGHGDVAEGADVAPADSAGFEQQMQMYSSGMMPGAGPAGGPGRQASAGGEQIAAALIDTLLAIHSLTSYQAARDLLEGKLELPFTPEKTAGWTMTSLIKHIEGANDPAAKMLKQTIEQPDLVRSGSGDLDASRLRDLSLQEHWTSALSVMDGLMGLQSSSLSKSRRRNNNYGGEGYGADGSGYDPAMAEGGESFPGGGPAGSFPGGGPAGSFPGGNVPGNPGAPNNNQPKADDANEVNPIPDNLTLADFTQEQALGASRYLWSPELVNDVAQRLTESETLMKDPPLLLLAGQLPTTSTRHAFEKFLKKNWLMKDDWTRNPSSFVRYDVFSKYMRDPGLVITLKHLPREQQANQNNNAGGDYGSYPGGAPPQQNNNNRAQNQDPEKLREQQIKHLWFETSEKFTLALMDRMLAAAQAGHLPKSNEDELGIKLHRNASITIDSRLELALGEASADPAQDTRDKTTVNYIRFESSELGKRELTHYTTALRKEVKFMILNNNGMWLSAPVEKDRRTGELISIDVLLSQNNARRVTSANNQQGPSNDIANLAPNFDNGGGGNQTYVIEILVVRVPDPEIFLQDPEQAVSAK